MDDNGENIKGDDLEEGELLNNVGSRCVSSSNRRYVVEEGQNSPFCTFKDHQYSPVLESSFEDMVTSLLKNPNPMESSTQNSNGILPNLDQNIVILDSMQSPREEHRR